MRWNAIEIRGSSIETWKDTVTAEYSLFTRKTLPEADKAGRLFRSMSPQSPAESGYTLAK
jgi:hypothetical protein